MDQNGTRLVTVTGQIQSWRGQKDCPAIGLLRLSQLKSTCQFRAVMFLPWTHSLGFLLYLTSLIVYYHYYYPIDLFCNFILYSQFLLLLFLTSNVNFAHVTHEFRPQGISSVILSHLKTLAQCQRESLLTMALSVYFNQNLFTTLCSFVHQHNQTMIISS